MLAVVATLSIGTLACSAQQKVESVYTPMVYAAVIDSLFPRTAQGEYTLVLHDEMDSYLAGRVSPSFVADIDTIANGDSVLTRNFWARAARGGVLKPFVESVRKRLRTEVILTDSATLGQMYAEAQLDFEADPQKLPVQGFWERFYRAYPSKSMLVNFSPVGYNEDRTRAVLYVKFACDGMCGGSYTVLLTREETTWRVLRARDGYVV